MSSLIDYLGKTYFHQDFQYEADEPTGNIQKFCHAESLQNVNGLRDEIVALIDSDATEEDLCRFWVDDADSYYEPENDGLTMRQWLQQIIDVLDKSTEPPAPALDADRAAAPDSRPEIPFKGITGA